MRPTDEHLPAGKEWRYAFDPGSPETILPTTLAGFLAHAEDVEETGEQPMLGLRATSYRAELDGVDVEAEAPPNDLVEEDP